MEKVNFNSFNLVNKCLSVSIDYTVNLNSKCKDCPFFSPERTHGHGDFWGNCNLIQLIDKDYYNSICYNETNCRLSTAIFIIDGKICYTPNLLGYPNVK